MREIKYKTASMKFLAPIVLFVYNRPNHTRKTIDALKKCSLALESDLFIYSDAPKSASQSEAVNKVRKFICKIDGFQSVKIIERDSNFGLANSIIDGVSRVCEEYGRVIVLEDDLIVSPYFLEYMNAGLDLYENDANVVSIHGYTYPVSVELPNTFFIRGADCWGWGTWKRGWAIFEPDGKKLLTELKKKNLIDRFNYYGAYSFSGMLKDQIAKRNSSWAIRWHASAFVKNLLTLYPGKSLVINIGFDSSGIHCGSADLYDVEIDMNPVILNRIPVVESIVARHGIEDYFRKTHGGLVNRIGRRIKNYFI